MDNSFGKRLKTLRKKAGLTQEKIAERTGYSIMTVRRWEWGTRNPRLEEIKALAQALNVPESDLLNDQPLDNLEDWILTIRISHDNEEVIDLPRGIIPTVCEVHTNLSGGFVKLGGSYDLWLDDKKYSQFKKDMDKVRSAVIQNGKALGCLP